MICKTTSIFIAGHNGMVGSAILRMLKSSGYSNLITSSRSSTDLTIERDVDNFFNANRPEIVILAAAKVGGINANVKQPVEFLLNNLKIQNNIIDASQKNGIKKIIFLGSSCIYPKESPQPITEKQLMQGPLEPTNEGYALAKICGIKLLQYYHRQYGLKSISLMPCNLYGTNDHFDLEKAHVLSSLVRRFTDAVTQKKDEVVLWGTGVAKREFLHVEDCARAVLFFMAHDTDFEIINIGTGKDISIKELAQKIADKTGFKGVINWDSTKPDGMLRKCLDVSYADSLGFSPQVSLDEGISRTISEYKELTNQK